MLSRLLLQFSFLTLFSSCSKVSQVESKLQHEAGLSTPDVIPVLWTEVTREEHEKDIKKLFIFDRSYPETHPMTMRVQFWLNAIDGAMRRRYPSRMSVVPVPKAFVLAGENINAYVNETYLCLDVDVVLEGHENEHVNPYLKISYSDGVLSSKYNTNKCLSTDKVKDLIPYINRNMAPLNGCQMKLKHGRVVTSSACKNKKFDENAHGLYLPSTTNFITIYDNFMKQLSEKELVTILSHELAHYYRSHIISSAFVESFYKIEKNNLTYRPIKNTIYEDLGQDLLQMGYLADYSLRPIERNPTLGWFYIDANNIANFVNRCETDECRANCTAYSKVVVEAEQTTAIEKMGVMQLNDNETDVVTKLEQTFNTCASHFFVDEKGIAKQTISYSIIDEEMKKSVLFSKMLSYDNILSLKEYINLYSSDFDSKNAEIQNKVKQIKKQRLGYYTFEQEADDLSAEILSFINIAPQNGVDLMLTLSKMGEQKPVLWSDYSYEKCKALKDNNWKDANGVDVFIPFGGAYRNKSFDPHHASCFRAWNYYREIKAHNYVINPSAEPVPPGGSYADILTTFRKYDNVKIP